MRRLLPLLMSLLWAAPAWATVQVGVGGSAVAFSASAVNYFTLFGQQSPLDTQNQRQQIIPTAGTFTRLRMSLDAAPDNGAGVDTYTFVVMLGASTTALTCVITDAETTCESNAFVAVTAGQLLSIRSTPANTPTATDGDWSMVFIATDTAESILGGNTQSDTLSTSGDEFISVAAGSAASATETTVQMVMPTAGNLVGMYVAMIGGDPDNGAGTDAYQFTLRVNVADQTTFQCTVSETATTCSDVVGTFALVAGDLLTVESTPSNTPQALAVTVGFAFEAASPEDFVIANSSGAALLDAASAVYNRLSASRISWTTTEDNFTQLPQAMVIKSLYVTLTADPDNGAGTQSYELRLRNSVANTGLAVTISSGATTGFAHATEVINAGQFLAMQSTPSNTPTAVGAYFSVVASVMAARLEGATINAGVIQ